MKKQIVTSIAIAFATGIALAQGPQLPPAVVGVAKVVEEDYSTERRYIGRVTAVDSVSIVARVAGEIVEVCFEEGATVKKGDVLYKLDDTTYRAAVLSAEAQVAQCKASLDYAAKTFERTSALFEKKVASSDDMDSATSGFEKAKAALSAAEASLLSAKDNLDHTVIASPVDGRVGANAYTVGNYVSLSSGPLTSVVSVDPVRVKFSLSNRDILELFGGMENLRDDLVVTVDLADGKPLGTEGRFLFQDNAANVATDSIGLTFEFPSNNGTLLPGSAVTVRARRKTQIHMASIPITAVIRTAKGSMVYVVEDGKAQPREVETGASVDNMIFVKSGLAAGETVISKGTHKVSPGREVQTRE